MAPTAVNCIFPLLFFHSFQNVFSSLQGRLMKVPNTAVVTSNGPERVWVFESEGVGVVLWSCSRSSQPTIASTTMIFRHNFEVTQVTQPYPSLTNTSQNIRSTLLASTLMRCAGACYKMCQAGLKQQIRKFVIFPPRLFNETHITNNEQ